MIYLVSKNSNLFGSEKYQEIPFLQAMSILEPLKYVQLDTETKGSKSPAPIPRNGNSKVGELRGG